MPTHGLIKIKQNRDLMPEIFNYDIILFQMGINNSFSNGFSYEVGLNFPEVFESENETGYGDLRKYGTIHETEEKGIKFIACYTKKNNKINTELLGKCLFEINEKYKGLNIAVTIPEESYIQYFEKYITDCKLTIYEENKDDYKLRIFREIAEARKRLKEKEIDKTEYLKIRSNIEWRRKHGIFIPQPEDYEYSPRGNKNKILFRGKVKQY